MYQTPSYDPYRSMSPYANSTSVAREMQLEHERMLAASRSQRLDRIARGVHDLRYRVDELDRKFNAPVALYSTYEDPEPSVEVVNTTPSWLSGYWHALTADPIWEIFKRPSIK